MLTTILRTARAAVLCALTVLAACGLSRAQYVDVAAQKAYAIKVGAYLPTQKDIRQVSSTALFSVEADVAIQRFPERSSVSLASIGYIEKGNVRMIPVTVSQIYRDPSNASGVHYYYGGGVGLYSTRINGLGTDGKVKTLFGGFIVTGLDITRSNFVELKYHYISKYNDKFLGGFQLGLGTRF